MTTPDLELESALSHHRAGRINEAAVAYLAILERDPDHFDALQLFGALALQLGRLDQAASLIERAIAVRPDFTDVYGNLATAYFGLDRQDEALKLWARALEAKPDNVNDLFNLANALGRTQRPAEAVVLYRRALELEPDWPEALTNMASALIEINAYAEAEQAARQALTLDPVSPKAALNLGVALQCLGRLGEARAAFEGALHLDPEYANAHNNLAAILREVGESGAAVDHAKRARQTMPESPEPHNALGNAQLNFGEAEDAVASFRRAVQLAPEAPILGSNLLLSMHYSSEETRDSIYQESLCWAARHAPWIDPKPRPARPLKRIGFVSGDFRRHPVGYFLEPVLKHRPGFETVLFENHHSVDPQTEKLRAITDRSYGVRSMDSQTLAKLVQDEGIDVLIDLSGHTAEHRLDVMALRPAPMQLTWLGYSGTTGLSQIDGLIGDAVVTPREHQGWYTERLLHLPFAFLCAPMWEDLTGPPSEGSRPERPFTFGCFNTTVKVNFKTIDLWSQILQRTPGSRLFLKHTMLQDPQVVEAYLKRFAERGIRPERLDLRKSVERSAHLDTFGEVDLALDPVPYNGGTTSIDNLAMGVPVLTLQGDRYSARMTSSFLNVVGASDFVAATEEEYVSKAVGFASDLSAFTEIKTPVGDAFWQSPLANRAAFSEAFFSLIESAWSERGQAAA
ncbi:MAG: tetratricopeptide repeat protein [Fimbriimonadaceae bacterium]|nr:MAG: tetratricopeptide repeat protein [Fimbriimonadaceae bacterium]